MRLTSLRLQNFRGVEDKKVKFADGVTIIAGQNETGKSSMMEALRLLRLTKHTSRAQAVLGLQPVGKDVAPRVTLVGRVGGENFEYTKQWVRGPAAELKIEGATRRDYTDHEAHDEFEKLLEGNLDLDLFDALEVTQGDSMDQPQLGKIRALRSALKGRGSGDDSGDGDSDGDSGEGALDGGQEGVAGFPGRKDPVDHLMEKVAAERSRYFTAQGRPRKELQTATDELEAAVNALAEVAKDAREIEDLTRDHENLTRGLIANEEKLREASKDLDDLSEEQKQVARAEATVDKAKAQRATLAAEAELAESRWNAYTQEQKRVEGLRQDVAKAQGEAKTAEEDLETATADHVEFEKLAEQARAEAARRSEEQAEAVAAAQKLKDTAEFSRLQTDKAGLEKAMSDQAKAKAALASLKVTDADLKGLREHDAQVLQAESALKAASAAVRVESLGAERVLVNGEAHEDLPADLNATNPLTVEVPGQVRLTVSPPKDLATYQQDLEQAQKGLAERLTELGADSVEDAQRLSERRRQVETEQKVAKDLLDQLGGQETLAQLVSKVSDLEAKLGSKPGETPTAEQVEQAEAKAVQAGTAAEAAREAREKAERDLQAKISVLNVAKSTAEKTEQARFQAEARLADALALGEDAKTSEEDLREAHEKAQEAAKSAQQNLESAVEALSELDPDTTARLLDNAEALVERFKREARDDADRIVETKALLDRLTAQGVYDKHREAEADHVAAQSKEARVKARAAAVKLLWETLDKHRAKAHERLVEPLEKTIADLGQPIFGKDFEVKIGEDLTIESRSVGGPYIAFEDLSGGTKEQLSVIGRLAAATLVEEEGVPVIFDDTLGFSDPERLKALGLVLSEIGEKAQVVVLTCQPDRYDSVGRAEMVSLD